jgi:amino-acid racemase
VKLIGIIGGMSWESSLEYYRIMNETVRATLGGWHSARVLMYSVDFHEIEAHQRSGDWKAAAEMLSEAAVSLEKGGAELIVIATNTMHKIAPEVKASVAIPLVHIADGVAEAITKQGLKTVGLLGTRFTMEEDFLKGYLETEYALQIIIPEADEMTLVHDVIYNELCLGTVSPNSKRSYIEIIHRMAQRGAQGVILGCTEIPLLVQQADVALPLFDTTTIHAKKAVELAIE